MPRTESSLILLPYMGTHSLGLIHRRARSSPSRCPAVYNVKISERVNAMTTVPELFGSRVFDDRVMKARLSGNVYNSLKQTIEAGKKLDLSVANAVAAGDFDCGILICGTGVGISIAANKVNGIRAAVCSEPTTARLVKEHNNANIIAFGERIVGVELAKDIVKAYLSAEFLGGRHGIRVDMISDIEKRN